MTLQRNAEGMAFPDDFSFISDEALMGALPMTPQDEVRLAEGEWVGFDAHLKEVLIDGEPVLSEGELAKVGFDFLYAL